MTKEELKKLIGDSPLAEEVKNTWLERIESEDLTKELYDELIDTMQMAIDQAYDEAGVKVNENDPDVKKAYEEMVAEIKAANDEYSATINDLNKQTAKIQADADKDFSQLTADVVKGKLP